MKKYKGIAKYALSVILRPFYTSISMYSDDIDEKSALTEMEKMMQENRNQDGGVFRFLGEMLKVVLLALAIIVPVRYFLIKPFYVNGASMEPSYHTNEYLIIDELSYRFNEPKRGDVIVFKYPKDRSQFFIKRIIGLPGERVLVRDGVVFVFNEAYVNGKELFEPYLAPGTKTLLDTEVTLAEQEYFVLGDNREESLDSRRFGPVHDNDIIGRSWIRGWPIPRAGILEQYQFDF